MNIRPIRSVLIANRGEIAVRIARACAAMGIESIGVASESDRTALHARVVDRCAPLTGNTPAESYLNIEAVIAAAREFGADAIHPGYGFLAENAAFARAVAASGLIFIGPSPETIEAMGLKTRARATMQAAGVPVVPGCELPADADGSALRKAAESVGYPILVKASAGGGGKGMRAVADASQLEAAVQAAQREAAAAFGDSTVYLERRLERPRHVEVQVFGDAHGNVVHLFERDCSIQRRHQKVIEESPAPGLDAKLRAAMHAAAVAAARATHYVGAGTVEMLLDQSGEFFFLEMNTRLQVEHPVTELVTGVDLVAEQIRVAAGHPLSFAQEDLQLRGHAMEARVYAEDPAQNFLPQTGAVLCFDSPHGPGLRVDAGIDGASTVSLYYDPMLAKLIAYGRDREQARTRLSRALRETALFGVGHNLEYLQAILAEPDFAEGAVHTGFLEQHLGSIPKPTEEESAIAIAMAALATLRVGGAAPGRPSANGRASMPGLWTTLGPWRAGERT